MTEYIEREALIKKLKADPLFDLVERYGITEVIESIPAADVRPVRRGKWTLNKDGSGTCSECGRKQPGCWDLDNWDNFCHFCGADMRQTGDENV